MFRRVAVILALASPALAAPLLGGGGPLIASPYCVALRCTWAGHAETLPDPAKPGKRLAYATYTLANGDRVSEGMSMGYPSAPARYDYTGGAAGFIAFVRSVQDAKFEAATVLDCVRYMHDRGFNSYEMTTRAYTVGCASYGRYWIRVN